VWLDACGRGGKVRPKQGAAGAKENRLAKWRNSQQTNCTDFLQSPTKPFTLQGSKDSKRKKQEDHAEQQRRL
jgi:hypothetical protein